MIPVFCFASPELLNYGKNDSGCCHLTPKTIFPVPWCRMSKTLCVKI